LIEVCSSGVSFIAIQILPPKQQIDRFPFTAQRVQLATPVYTFLLPPQPFQERPKFFVVAIGKK
jgi:hypothetical protein